VVILQFVAQHASADRRPWERCAIWALRAGNPQRGGHMTLVGR